MIIVTIILYMTGMILIGLLFNRKGATETSDGFYIGGRSLGPVVTAMSAEASDMSSYLLMGLPGLAYIAGLAEVTWTAIGLSIGTYLNFLLVARLLRRYSERVGAFTIPDFYSKRYGDERHVLSCIAAVIILVFTAMIAWAMGYINEKKANGSIIPSWIIHTIANIFSGVCAAFVIF